MVPFDIFSLYSNVPLQHTIQICSDVLYRGRLCLPIIPENMLLECMRSATEGIEFCFNNVMYAQVDGISMGSPLGSMLANIFVGFHQSLLFERHSKPRVYLRYADDTFSIFDSIDDANAFHATQFPSFLSSVHYREYGE